MRNKSSLFVLGGLVGSTVVAGMVLAGPRVSADTSRTTTAAITVAASCSLTANVETEHTATLLPGVYSETYKNDQNEYPYSGGIGSTVLSALCNDNSGFAIYAVGYSGNSYGNNKLIGGTTGTEIATGTGTSGENSQWAMKVAKVTGGNAYLPANLTIENGYGSYHAVPDDYAKVASYSSVTDATYGAQITTTYAAYIAPAQVADTYTGQVKYTIVHPSSAAAPSIFSEYGVNSMQDFGDLTTAERAALIAKLPDDVTYTLTDERDEKSYNVVKLKDGNLWMQDNLALDLTNESIVNKLSASNTNATADSLTSLKSGNRNSGDNYATAGLTYSEWTSDYSYTTPLVKTTLKDSTIASATLTGEDTWKYGVYYNYCAASAGSYCYDSGSGISNATEDICPAGWKMPAGGNSGNYKALYSNSNYNYNTAALYRTALHLPLSGYVNSGSAYHQGSLGYWWSSTRYGDNFMYRLRLDASNVYPTDSYYRYYGFTVRCIASK